MKDKEQFKKEIFDKYEYYKNIKNDKFFNRRLYKNKYFSILKAVAMIMICVISTVGIVYAGVITYNNHKKANLNPTYTGKIGDTDMNNIWIGSFQLVWNEFLEQRLNDNVEFEDGASDLANELNKKSFTKDMLSSNDYHM